MSNNGIRVNTTGISGKGGNVTGTELPNGKLGMDINIANPGDISSGLPVSEDSGNSTATVLTNGSIFLGPWTQRAHAEILMAPSSDQNFTYYAQFATEQLSDALPYTAGTSDGVDSSVPYIFDTTDFKSRIPRRLIIAREWYRVAVVNTSGTDMTYLRFQTSVGKFDALASKLNAELLLDADAEVVRAIQAGQQPDGDYVNVRADGGAVDVDGVDVFSDTPLGSGANYESGWTDTDGFKSIEISIESDQVSADDGIIIEYTNDANAVTPVVELTKTFTFNADSVALGDLTILIPPRLDGFRVRYVNGSTAQSMFLLSLTLRTAPVQSVELPISSPINKNTNANITRTVSVGETPDAEFQNSVQSGVFTGGSTTTPLAAGGEFIGDWLDVSRYAQIYVFIVADVAYDDTAYTDSFGSTAGIVIDIRSADSGAADFTFDVTTLTNPPAHAFKQKPALKWFRLRYTNDTAAQSLFNITVNAELIPSGGAVSLVATGLSPTDLALTTAAASFGEDIEDNSLKLIPLISAGTEITNASLTLITKNVAVAENNDGTYGRINRVNNATRVYLDNNEITVRPHSGLDAFQVSAGEDTAIQIPLPNVTRVGSPRRLRITNQDSTVKLFYGFSSAVTILTGDLVMPGESVEIPLGRSVMYNTDGTTTTVEPQDVYLITSTLSASTETDVLPVDTTDSSSSVNNPTNVYNDNGSAAVFNSATDTVTYSGVDATGLGVLSNVQSVMLKMEARKEPSAAAEVSDFLDVVGQDAGNVTSITSPTVTASDDTLYLVSVSARDEFANITQINSTMGFTSFELVGDSLQQSAESRTHVYRAVGDPTGNGTITASFSQGADHCVIAVCRYENIDLTNPINSVTTNGANTSAGVYSGTLADGNQSGHYYIAMGFEQGSHDTALNPSTAVEEFQDGSTAGNDQIHNIVSRVLLSDGAVAFNGTCTGTGDISYVAVSLRPAPAKDPIMVMSHSEGSTTLTQELTSETYAVYEQDITVDAVWDVATLDAMTITMSPSLVGSADIQVDYIYVEVVSSSAVLNVPVSWTGDKP